MTCVKTLLSILACLSVWPLAAQDFSSFVGDPLLRTPAVRNPDNFMAPPVMRLGTADRLTFNFDIIGEDVRYLRYRLVHCNADWAPSRLLDSEIVEGFNEGTVDDTAFSSNTYTHFVNYSVVLPNADMSPLASGNYLLQVFDEGDPDEILLQLRFSVSENSAPVRAAMTTRTDLGFNSEWQQLSVAVDAGGLGHVNPYQDLVVTVQQNNRPQSEVVLPPPSRVDGNAVIYDHLPQLVFPGGNEYRRFETVRADYPGMGVDSVAFDGSRWHAWITPASVRAGHEYVYDRTQHGRFKVNEYSATDPDLGADYVVVHFSLDVPENPGSEIFVDGDFSLHASDDRHRMSYDREAGMYTLQIPLKQGSYNYQYTVRGPGQPVALPAPVEGNHYETDNEYLVKVFLRTPSSRGDRLIGTAIVN